MRPFRPLVLAAVVATSVGLALPATAAPSTPSAVDALSARTVAQIDALAQAKRGLTATEKKVDSRLLTEAKQRSGQSVAAGVGHVATGVSTDKQGMTAVDVLGNPNAVTPAVRAVGGRVIAASVAGNAVRASVPLTAVESLAGKAGVQHVGVAARAMLANEGGRVAPASKAELAKRISGALRPGQGRAGRHHGRGQPGLDGQRGRQGPRRRRGPARFKVTGTGVTVGVLSDGVDSLAASIASGDLPADTRVLPGQEGDGDEGTAMMEIVHDLAPNAHLIFATAFTSEDELRGQHPGAARGRRRHHRRRRRLLRRVAVPGRRSRRPSSTSPTTARSTSAPPATRQNVDDRTAGNWEGDYDASGQTIGKFAGEAHDWDPGPLTQVLNPVSDDSAGVPTILQWNDPQGAPATTTTCTRWMQTARAGVLQRRPGRQRRPVRGLQPAVRHRRPGRGEVQRREPLLPAHPFRGRFEDRPGLTAFNTPGVTRGHSAVPAAFSVAAVPAASRVPA